MAFRFVLAPLLHLRQSIERQRALRLREASLAVVRVEDALRQIERFLVDSAAADQAALSVGRTAAEIQFAAHYRNNLHVLMRMLRAELHDLQQKRSQAAAEYQRAFREREALEMLRARQRRRYQQEEARHEQRELDAAHLLQFWRNRSG